MPISLEDANKVIAGVHAKAAKMGVSVTAAVVDEGGHLIALGRMDGAPPLSPQIAEAKAVGAAMLLRDGGSLQELAEDRPGFFSAADRLLRPPPIPGARPVALERGGQDTGPVGGNGARPGGGPERLRAGSPSNR